MKLTLLVPALLLLASLTALRAADANPSKPNFVVILIDDMGYGDIGPFGSKVNRTPNLERMATEGMKFTSFYAAPVCTPSRAQMMTGCYAKRVSMPNVIGPVCPTGLSAKEKTVAALLKERGYATMAIGKWHLGDQPEFLPTRRGFDHYIGLPYSNDMGGPVKPREPADGARKDMRPPLPLVQDEKVIEAPAEQDKLTRLYTEEAVKFITANKDKPFFLYLPHTAVHVPLHPGPEFKGKSANGTYGDWVEEVDWSVGRVLETLRELKIEKNTLVLFTSDNGPWLIQGRNGGVGPLARRQGHHLGGRRARTHHRMVAGKNPRRRRVRCGGERDGRAADIRETGRWRGAAGPYHRWQRHLAFAGGPEQGVAARGTILLPRQSAGGGAFRPMEAGDSASGRCHGQRPQARGW
jgi:arylsulfatase A